MMQLPGFDFAPDEPREANLRTVGQTCPTCKHEHRHQRLRGPRGEATAYRCGVPLFRGVEFTRCRCAGAEVTP